MQSIVSPGRYSTPGESDAGEGAVVQHLPDASWAGAASERPGAGEGWAAAIIQSGATLTC